MSVKRYLELDSTFRNRKEFPLPSQFIVNISGGGANCGTNSKTALDPVSNAAPTLTWYNSFQEVKQGTSFIYLPYISGITVQPTGNSNFLITTTDQKLRQTRDFYVGCNLARDENGNYPATSSITNRRIKSYLPLDLNNGLVTLESSLPDDLVGLSGFFIQDPSTVNIYDLVVFNLNLYPTANPLVYGIFGPLKNVNGFYNNWKLQYGLNTRLNFRVFPVPEPWISVNVVNFQAIPGFPPYQITLSAPIIFDNAKYYYFLSSPSFTSLASANNYLKFFVPISNDNYFDTQRILFYGSGTDNYYINNGIMRTFDNTFAQISAFDNTTRLATLATPPFTYQNNFGDGESIYQYRWVNWEDWNFNFVMRKEQPIYTDFMSYNYNFSTGIYSAIQYGKSIQLGVNYNDIFNKKRNPGYTTDSLNGYFLRLSPYLNIVPPYPPPLNEQRKILRNIFSIGKFISLTPEYIILDKSASDKDEYYKDGILNIVYTPLVQPIKNQKIKSYIGSERKAIFENPIEVIPDPGPAFQKNYLINTAILAENFSAPVQFISPIYYEIEQYSYDNAQPFNYTGSLVSNRENVCYEIELVNLVIPNTTLISGRGGRAIFYPYFYVELKPLSSATTMSNGIICSNNPNALKMLFRAIVNDISAPEDSPFLKIDGDGMIHTVKFNIHDSFLFSVYHSNGELLKTDILDQYSPIEPNSRCQISACFSFKRI